MFMIPIVDRQISKVGYGEEMLVLSYGWYRTGILKGDYICFSDCDRIKYTDVCNLGRPRRQASVMYRYELM